MKILLTGVTGQLGHALHQRLAVGHSLICPVRIEFDLSNASQMSEFIRSSSPDLLINCAAYTNVDRAESEADLAVLINVEAPRLMAQEMQRLGGSMIHYSSDYVFDGKKSSAYCEQDIPAPLSVYGSTKLAGERAVAEECEAHLILRTSWIYGAHGHNFLKTILRLAERQEILSIVDDQIGAPTWAARLAECTAALLEFAVNDPAGLQSYFRGNSGLYQMSAGGSTSWYAYAKYIVQQTALYCPGSKATIKPIASIERPSPAKRPANSVMSNGKIFTAFGISLPQWEDDVAACLRQMH